MDPLKEIIILINLSIEEKDHRDLLFAWEKRQTDLECLRKLSIDDFCLSAKGGLEWGSELSLWLARVSSFLSQPLLCHLFAVACSSHHSPSLQYFSSLFKNIEINNLSADKKSIIQKAIFNQLDFLPLESIQNDPIYFQEYLSSVSSVIAPSAHRNFSYQLVNKTNDDFWPFLAKSMENYPQIGEQVSQCLVDDILHNLYKSYRFLPEYERKIIEALNALPQPSLKASWDMSESSALDSIKEACDLLQKTNWTQDFKDSLMPSKSVLDSYCYMFKKSFGYSANNLSRLRSLMELPCVSFSENHKQKKLAVMLQQVACSLIGSPYNSAKIEEVKTIWQEALKCGKLKPFLEKNMLKEINLEKNMNSFLPHAPLLYGGQRPHSGSFIKNKNVQDLMAVLPSDLSTTWKWMIKSTLPEKASPPKWCIPQGILPSIKFGKKGEAEWLMQRERFNLSQVVAPPERHAEKRKM